MIKTHILHDLKIIKRIASQLLRADKRRFLILCDISVPIFNLTTPFIVLRLPATPGRCFMLGRATFATSNSCGEKLYKSVIDLRKPWMDNIVSTFFISPVTRRRIVYIAVKYVFFSCCCYKLDCAVTGEHPNTLLKHKLLNAL